MLEDEKIQEYSELLKKCEEAKQEAQKIATEISMIKKQGIAKLKEKGYESFADVAKIDEEIAAIEKTMLEEIPKMREYIASVNEKRELKEKILMG